MRIGLSYDIKAHQDQEDGMPEDAFEEYDSPETIDALSKAIREIGHESLCLGGGVELLTSVIREKPDFVFNIAEGRGCYRSREAQVPSILEMLGIPYSGSDPLTLAVCLEKALTKQLVASVGVKTPKWIVVNSVEELCSVDWSKFPFPVIVKPVHEGSSKGIRNASMVDSASQLKELAAHQLSLYKQPIMVEQYIYGDEVTVGLFGNSPVRLLGIMRIIPRQSSREFIYSLEVKRNWKELVRYECPAQIDSLVMKSVETASVAAYNKLGIRDMARMDYRIADSGVPYFIEVNPLPGLNPESGDLVIMARAMGWSYTRLIGTILDSAMRRYGFVS